jgi:Dienelactone hydrolase family
MTAAFRISLLAIGLASLVSVGGAWAGSLVEFANISEQGPATLVGYLARPDQGLSALLGGAGHSVERFPAVVVLHECGGISSHSAGIADRLGSEGYVGLIGDTAYGSAEMLNWLVHDRGIEPHIPVFDKSQRTDGTFSRDDFSYDHATDTYRCPAGKTLQHYRRRFAIPRTGIMKDNSMRYRASKRDCQACHLKSRCCPTASARKISRSIYEGARDLAREIAKTEAYQTSRRSGYSSKRSSERSIMRCAARISAWRIAVVASTSTMIAWSVSTR